jgi:hypothetical protein
LPQAEVRVTERNSGTSWLLIHVGQATVSGGRVIPAEQLICRPLTSRPTPTAVARFGDRPVEYDRDIRCRRAPRRRPRRSRWSTSTTRHKLNGARSQGSEERIHDGSTASAATATTAGREGTSASTTTGPPVSGSSHGMNRAPSGRLRVGDPR